MTNLPRIVRLPIGDDVPTARLYYGLPILDALVMLPEDAVHVVCTSPPYWGLRDYGVEPQEWPEVVFTPMPGISPVVIPAQTVALGLEDNPMEYVAHLVAVFRELRRVLRYDGVLWLNLGDTYAGYHGNKRVPDDEAPSNKPGYVENMRNSTVGNSGLKNKDQVGIPWRVAFALQADGWFLRNDIVWAKQNCMPEPVRDRCTRNHEYVFMFSKSPRYYYDNEAIKEPLKHPTHTGSRYGGDKQHVHHRPTAPDHWSYSGRMYDASGLTGRNKRTVWNVNPKPFPGAHFAVWPPKLVEPMIKAGSSEHGVCPVCGAPWARSSEGWEPTCECGADGVSRATVLDPFSGSGTTGMVALRLGRDYVGIDLQFDYLDMAAARVVGESCVVSDDDGEETVLDLFGE